MWSKAKKEIPIKESGLDHFTYIISLDLDLFILAVAEALSLALRTVLFQTVKTASADPTGSLRQEQIFPTFIDRNCEAVIISLHGLIS
jgi:hypothetical protein